MRTGRQTPVSRFIPSDTAGRPPSCDYALRVRSESGEPPAARAFEWCAPFDDMNIQTVAQLGPTAPCRRDAQAEQLEMGLAPRRCGVVRPRLPRATQTRVS